MHHHVAVAQRLVWLIFGLACVASANASVDILCKAGIKLHTLFLLQLLAPLLWALC